MTFKRNFNWSMLYIKITVPNFRGYSLGYLTPTGSSPRGVRDVRDGRMQGWVSWRHPSHASSRRGTGHLGWAWPVPCSLAWRHHGVRGAGVQGPCNEKNKLGEIRWHGVIRTSKCMNLLSTMNISITYWAQRTLTLYKTVEKWVDQEKPHTIATLRLLMTISNG